MDTIALIDRFSAGRSAALVDMIDRGTQTPATASRVVEVRRPVDTASRDARES